MTKPITIELLKKNEACQDQIDKFKEFFGEEVVPTRELCLLHAHDFNFKWAQCLLPTPVRRVYNDNIVLLWQTTYTAVDPHWENYRQSVAMVWFDAWEIQDKA